MAGQISILVSGQHDADRRAQEDRASWRYRPHDSGMASSFRAHAGSPRAGTRRDVLHRERWENGRVRPSSLAWKALLQVAAERGTPLVDERESASPE